MRLRIPAMGGKISGNSVNFLANFIPNAVNLLIHYPYLKVHSGSYHQILFGLVYVCVETNALPKPNRTFPEYLPSNISRLSFSMIYLRLSVVKGLFLHTYGLQRRIYACLLSEFPVKFLV